MPGKQKMVATWHTKNGLSRKRGILRISRDYMHELDIICTTALGMHGTPLISHPLVATRDFSRNSRIGQRSNEQDDITVEIVCTACRLPTARLRSCLLYKLPPRTTSVSYALTEYLQTSCDRVILRPRERCSGPRTGISRCPLLDGAVRDALRRWIYTCR